MTPALAVLLCLGLCLCKRTRTQAADRLHKPSLRAENGSVVPKGGAVTLMCRGPWEAEEWLLEKKNGSGWSRIKYVRQTGNEGEFSLPSVTSDDAGTYKCLYRHSSYGWSQHSDPLELVVTGLSAPPSLAALPSYAVASGQSVTLQCRSELWHDWFALCKDGEEIRRGGTRRHGRGCQAEFFFPAVTLTHIGTYGCFGFNSSSSSLWSSPSSPLVLRVSDAAALDYTVGNLVRLTLAGLVLVLLGVLLAEHWKSSREQPIPGVLG
ncbi:leukocyte immunoglobulin-like receptor subfamily A member 5 [Monodelphis domestica]|uniref:leukocyte immunoglobulin-like receptor subfamily A member 5 n=1 Tax=Monodelphis domestica TaxID=13616 RepID=UPI0024E274A2|nr:leukocyte immunoglobulin-like receptor subfamily A member 5 [Monodelphis domestica]